jgi:hypothetical protein
VAPDGKLRAFLGRQGAEGSDAHSQTTLTGRDPRTSEGSREGVRPGRAPRTPPGPG